MKLEIGALVKHTRRWDLKLGLIVEIVYTEAKMPLYDVSWSQIRKRIDRHLEDELQSIY